MKKLIMGAMFFFIGCASIMTPDQMALKEAIDIPGMSKDIIYNKSLQFIMLSFQSSEGITQYHDQKEGKIIEKGWIRAYGWSIELTLLIEATNGQSYISVIPMSWWGGGAIYDNEYKSYKIWKEQQKIINAYRNYLTSSISKEKLVGQNTNLLVKDENTKFIRKEEYFENFKQANINDIPDKILIELLRVTTKENLSHRLITFRISKKEVQNYNLQQLKQILNY